MTRFLVCLLLVLLLAGCNSGTPWRGGPYVLIWSDRPDNVRLEYQRPEGGVDVRVEPRVFAVGRNDHYVVAKQHPKGDRSVTNFFVIDATHESHTSGRGDVVRGPLNAREFERLSRELDLPPFTKVLPSLQ